MTVTGYYVMPARLTDAAQVFTDPQESTGQQADQLRSSGDVVTGDQGLDAMIHETMDLTAEACSRFGQVFSATATALNQTANDYASLDTQIATAYASLATGPTTGGSPSDGTLVPGEPLPMV
jgi:type VII secretion effector (TIGR04197 family)